jgi:hypothetical protein
MGKPVTFLDRLRNAHRIVAGLTAENAVYAPIFERLDAELKRAEAVDDVQARARAVVERYRATDATTL